MLKDVSMNIFESCIKVERRKLSNNVGAQTKFVFINVLGGLEIGNGFVFRIQSHKQSGIR